MKRLAHNTMFGDKIVPAGTPLAELTPKQLAAVGDAFVGSDEPVDGFDGDTESLEPKAKTEKKAKR